jgi:hypothetical protein
MENIDYDFLIKILEDAKRQTSDAKRRCEIEKREVQKQTYELGYSVSIDEIEKKLNSLKKDKDRKLGELENDMKLIEQKRNFIIRHLEIFNNLNNGNSFSESE